jgi:ACS family D-galactonate transporter-like MFS transporter
MVGPSWVEKQTMGDLGKSNEASGVSASLNRPTAVRWQIVALLMAFSFMSWFNRVSMSAAGDISIMKQYDISPTQMGFVYSALLFSYAVCMTPGGWLSDRFGPRLTLVFMGFGSALFGALTGLPALAMLSAFQLWLALLVIRGLMGTFTAPIYPASGRIIAHWMPLGQRAWANGLVTGAALLGIASTYVGFGFLIDRFDWPVAFLITGTVTAVLALAWAVYATDVPAHHPRVNEAEKQLIQADELVPRGPTDPTNQPRAAPARAQDRPYPHWSMLLRNRSLVLLTLSYSAVGYFEYLFYFWMHHYFDDVLKVGEETSRIYTTFLYLAMAAGMFLGGWLSDRLHRTHGHRLGRVLVPVGGMLASAALLVVGILATDPVWILVWFGLAMAAIGATEGPFWATAIELGGRWGATSAGIFNTGGNAGGLLAPVLTPWVSELFGWPWGIGLGSIYCLFGVFLWFWIDPAERCNDAQAAAD